MSASQRTKAAVVALAAVLFLGLTATAEAVPTLQLYIEGSQYDAASESWVTEENPFDLLVLGAISPKTIKSITELTLLVALPQAKTEPLGDISVTITADTTRGAYKKHVDKSAFYEDGTVTLTTDELLEGDPGGEGGFYGGKNYAPHGIYPTHFWAVPLPDLDVAGEWEDIYNYNEKYDPDDPGASSDSGDIQYYTIHYHHDFGQDFIGDALYFDVVGLAINEDKNYWRSAPFSHNARAVVVPEPATALLLLGGLAGLIAYKRRQN